MQTLFVAAAEPRTLHPAQCIGQRINFIISPEQGPGSSTTMPLLLGAGVQCLSMHLPVPKRLLDKKSKRINAGSPRICQKLHKTVTL